jgi:hypothetical protein
MDWKCAAIIVVALILCASLIAPMAMAKGDDGRGERGEHKEFRGEGAKGFELGESWRIHGGDWDRWHGESRGGVYGGYYPAYTYVQHVACPVYIPANFGGDQGACYQACVNSGQYSPAQCGQWCYYA